MSKLPNVPVSTVDTSLALCLCVCTVERVGGGVGEAARRCAKAEPLSALSAGPEGKV